MKTLLGLIAIVVAMGAVRRLAAVWRPGLLLGKLEAAIERCPPIQAMRKLEQQNNDVIRLLREQNALLRRESPAEESGAESAYGETFVS